MDEIALVPRLPTVDEYRYLLACVGWPVPPTEAAQVSLNAAVGGVCALVDGQIVGMGRLISVGVLGEAPAVVHVPPNSLGKAVVVDRAEDASTGDAHGERRPGGPDGIVGRRDGLGRET
jgi:hypothetical protein